MKSVLRIFFSARGTNPWVVLVCLIVASLCEGIGFATLTLHTGVSSLEDAYLGLVGRKELSRAHIGADVE